MKAYSRLVLFTLSLLFLPISQADSAEIRVAVASNFTHTFKRLAQAFEDQSGHQLVIASGSTGKHYAQIIHGAPFDLFFAADELRPQLLEQQGRTISGTRFTYAYGKLVLWQPKNLIPGDSAMLSSEHRAEHIIENLKQGGFSYLAIANPLLAPYGKAAEQTLIELGLWDKFHDKMVRGENISQAFHFVHSGNAQMGFVAYSQLKSTGLDHANSYWLVPSRYYQPITQQAVMLTDSPAAAAFISFMRSAQASHIIRLAGYLSAEENKP